MLSCMRKRRICSFFGMAKKKAAKKKVSKQRAKKQKEYERKRLDKLKQERATRRLEQARALLAQAAEKENIKEQPQTPAVRADRQQRADIGIDDVRVQDKEVENLVDKICLLAVRDNFPLVPRSWK